MTERTYQATERLPVTLEAQQWNQVLGLLHEVLAPLRVTQPLVQAIAQQLQHPREATNGDARRPDAEHHAHQPAMGAV